MKLCHFELRYFQKDMDKQLRNTLQEHLEVSARGKTDERDLRTTLTLIRLVVHSFILSPSSSSVPVVFDRKKVSLEWTKHKISTFIQWPVFIFGLDSPTASRFWGSEGSPDLGPCASMRSHSNGQLPRGFVGLVVA